ncbi:MAG: methylmalonyl-CoA carboxyltransferase, partial [Deltaproteobacteria bacterium]|nr:methylmalonyl-CoA carboxyltransferase [Deltaproteobacteria bacterium]
QEIGLLTHSSRPEAAEATPADGKIIGHGLVADRPVLAVANDLTVMGASSAATNMKKIEYVRSLSCDRGLPLVFLGESTGARIPDVMGAGGMAQGGQNPAQYRRLREAPWLSILLGPCFGSSAWYSAMSDVNIMLKGAVMAVSSPRVTRIAIGEDTPPEELGGWRVHAQTTGLVDLVGDTEEDCLALARQVLGFLPTSAGDTPPRLEKNEISPPKAVDPLDIIPQKKNQVYDVRRLLETLFDGGQFLELKARFARPCVTALARLDGRPVGVIANNPYYGAGALTADCCDKVTSFLVLCDSYNLPLVMLVDTPGFLIGRTGERQRVVGKIINWMNALSLVTVPVVTVIVGKSYGQAYLNMGAGKYSSTFAAWPTAQISFMGPEPALSVVYDLRQEDDPQRFAQLLEEVEKDIEPWDAAGVFGLHDIIEPAETRPYLIRMLDLHTDRRRLGIGGHLLHNWPTSY